MSLPASATIHPSSVVEPGARLGADVRIGPFCLVGPDVVLGDGVEIRAHAVVTGRTEIGAGSTVFPFACVGEIPQDLKFSGEATRLVIGPRARIREGVTVNTGTAQGGGLTRIGADCLLMAGAHVAHDAQVGDRVILVNNASLAGHCVVGDDVIVGGLSGVHQWVRIGRGAIIGAVTMVTHDVMPHALVQGPRGRVDGLNLVGLKRRGVSRADITALRAAFQTLRQGEGTFQDRARRLAEEATSSEVREIAAFVLVDSDRGYLVPT